MEHEYVVNKDVVDDTCADVLSVTTLVRPLTRDAIHNELVRLRNIKWHIACRIRFKGTTVDGDTDVETQVTHGQSHTLLIGDKDEINQVDR